MPGELYILDSKSTLIGKKGDGLGEERIIVGSTKECSNINGWVRHCSRWDLNQHAAVVSHIFRGPEQCLLRAVHVFQCVAKTNNVVLAALFRTRHKIFLNGSNAVELLGNLNGSRIHVNGGNICPLSG